MDCLNGTVNSNDGHVAVADGFDHEIHWTAKTSPRLCCFANNFGYENGSDLQNDCHGVDNGKLATRFARHIDHLRKSPDVLHGQAEGNKNRA